MTEDKNTAGSYSLEESESCCAKSTCCAPQSPVTRATKKIGRNDLCPCGSERKFKKCCGNASNTG